MEPFKARLGVAWRDGLKPLLVEIGQQLGALLLFLLTAIGFIILAVVVLYVGGCQAEQMYQ